MIKILKIVLIAILSIVTVFVLIVFRLYAIKIYDSVLQQSHMKKLEAYYEDSYTPVDESQFVNFDRFDDETTLDEIQMLASHNSYKKTGSDIGKFFIGLGDSFAEARALKYGYQNLTEQFEVGIRSMEFDLRKRKSSFVLTHVPLVDNSSVAPDFAMALEEINLYSENNPTHIPIVILLEIKEDWMILDHALQDISREELIELDELLENKLGTHLYKPSDFMQDGLSIRETILNHGWPTVTSLLGKVIFVLHPNNMNQAYLDIDSSLETQSMFIGSYADELETDYASFVVQNEVDVNLISSLVSNQYIVRTRIDESLLFDQDRMDEAIISGAQILTSDFTKGRKDLDQDEMITLNNYTVIKRTT
ncbi:MAG: hypothetical protein A2Y45_03575 [Tenericutes bacterium GWC2_34_14]|nr:MAG: hypothetical protein A2Z84_07190 [Tenericutes bacterium GWA2_35_7]OHE29214.1 MAG: hypothetical protein A2Y45_03575 [Tenericutes bacterium GWC2_34_14]OHE34297.1 MAG: hypothetical protein A2012_09165 [Tenericutes bacterium GWE2_34_108]OHE35649.1 MAG: hypothetical protein A2Y46_05930 [Tenericutes bacterium GWF1_35_14]OHE38864.1 MAG: hypothetical protein A2Y44_00365 [Tenericutes bacterium GWF2_35_184]OHE43896.1 MAG: hypothetical protein A2221_10260 [Tenericutes bacterium RIFOXYA2_FULL_36_3